MDVSEMRINVKADTSEVRNAVDEVERALRRLHVLMPVSEGARITRMAAVLMAGVALVFVAAMTATSFARQQLLRELIVDSKLNPQAARCAVYGDEGTQIARMPPCDALIAKAAAIFVPSGSQVLIPAAPPAEPMQAKP